MVWGFKFLLVPGRIWKIAEKKKQKKKKFELENQKLMNKKCLRENENFCFEFKKKNNLYRL